MVHLTKAFAIVALLCPVTLATPCVSGSCAEDHDETSLVQLKNIVTHGSARQPKEMLEEIDAEKTETDQPIVNWRAEIESMPDHLDKGSVTKAYDENLKKERGLIVEKADSKIHFDAKVEKARRANREAAEEKVKDLDKAVRKAIKADEAQVKEVAAKKRAVEQAAKEEVERSKEQWEAHHIKKEQAEKYAIEGRLEGARQGADEADRRIADAREAAEEAAEDRRLAEEKAAAAKRIAEKRAAIDRVTEEEAEADRRFVDRAAAAATDVEAHAAARASRAEEAIEGAEAMKDKLITQAANRDKAVYERRVGRDQKRINEADAAKWPKGDWPDP